MKIPNNLIPDLNWWKNTINTSVNKIKTDEYCLEIFSDASTTGWGAACGAESASGQWSRIESTHHINYLELLAAFFGLKIFARHLSDCQILLRIDNTTAVSYINRMGGIQFPHLTDVTKKIWQWCEQRRLYIFASYIRSCDNSVADAESRKVHPDIEWELADDAFKDIVHSFGHPTVDLFASRVNNKCPSYVSWHKDPDSIAVNAFTISWSQFYFYAFPPFTMILKSLRKIITDKAKGIMVVPYWPAQPWYPLYLSLLVSKPLIFKASDNLLISRTSSNQNFHTKITLVAGVLSKRP